MYLYKIMSKDTFIRVTWYNMISRLVSFLYLRRNVMTFKKGLICCLSSIGFAILWLLFLNFTNFYKYELTTFIVFLVVSIFIAFIAMKAFLTRKDVKRFKKIISMVLFVIFTYLVMIGIFYLSVMLFLLLLPH